MQLMYQFFRLIRLSNILVIVLTMCVFYGLLSNYHLDRQYIIWNVEGPLGMSHPSLLEQIGLTDYYFILLIISVVLVSASGNIINDYFDVKADRVNKPNRLIIDKYIKRRWAIILNWTFNGVGFLIAFYLSYVLENWWILFLGVLTINLLYFYSAIYKRKFLSGNLIVAFLTGIVPFCVFTYVAFSNFGSNPHLGLNDDLFIWDNFFPILIYGSFAFLLTLIREIIKDMADVKGDLLLKSQTFPIRYGFKKTKYFLTVLYLIAIISLCFYMIMGVLYGPSNSNGHPNFMLFIYSLILVVVFLSISAIIMMTKRLPKHYLHSSNFIKLAMLFGIISALFYAQ